MKALQYILGLAFLTTVAFSCKKDSYTDVSLVDSGVTPSKLSALFTITQDNTGMVTITPNGEGGTIYDVYFGDGTTSPANIQSGGSAVHKYKEGNYTVRVVAHGITGKTAEMTKTLTVAFRAPENLVVSVAKDAINGFKVNVSATALYETFFQVYFGDVPNEVPISFLEGDVISHTYAAPGTYTVKVVALSGGAATTTYTTTVSISGQIKLPVTFDDPGYDYSVIDFGNNQTVDATDPLNSANKIKKTTKPNGAEVWAGTTIGTAAGFASPVPLTATQTQMTMRVYSPAAGIHIRLKIEDHNNGAISVETEAITTVANTWETLIFDFAYPASGTPAINLANTYDKASVFFDFGNTGNGKVFLWDDIKFSAVNSYPALVLPLNFENTGIPYTWLDFAGGNVTVIDNPQVSGINTSARVAKMIKYGGQTYGGSSIVLNSAINFSSLHTMKMKVYSPRVGAKVLLKVENAADGSISFEKEVLTTTANAWEQLTFDYTGISTTNAYQKITIIFDNGTMGDGSANYTFLFDDITLN